MSSVYSTDAGGTTRSAENYSISAPAYTYGNDFMAGLQGQANSMNAARKGGGGGGGGGGQSTMFGPRGEIQKIFADQYTNPTLDFEKWQAAVKNAHWDQAFGALAGRMGGGDPYTIGGGVKPPPEITVGGVYNPQETDQMVAASRAKTAKSTATAQRTATEQALGSGFSPNSPLILALQGNLAGRGIGTEGENEADIRLKSAQANKQQLLASQAKRLEGWGTGESLAIQRARPYFDRDSALFAAMANLANT